MACNSITPQIEDLAKRLKVTPQEASNIVSLYQSQTEHKNQFPSVDEAKVILDKRSTVVNSKLSEIDTIKQKALANGTFMKAPNGKPTNLNEKQWLQVRTKAFKDWFGDWENDPENASKVVDENGEPLVCYHESLDEFSTFDINRKRFDVHHVKGIWVSIKDKEGTGYGKYVYPLFVKLLHPNKTFIDPTATLEKQREIENEALKNPDTDGTILDTFDKDGREIQIYTKTPNQVKSAVENNGDFSSTNDNIYYQQDSRLDFMEEYQKLSALSHTYKTLSSVGSISKIDTLLKNKGINQVVRKLIIKAIELNPELKKLSALDIFNLAVNLQYDDLLKVFHENYSKEVNEGLENLLKPILDKYHITIEESDMKKFGGALGTFDILNKVIYLAHAQDRNATTMPEEFAHAFVELLGTPRNYKKNKQAIENKDFHYLMDNVESTAIYKETYEQYKTVYTDKEGNPDVYKIKKEAIGKALAAGLLNNFESKTQEESSFWSKLKNWFNSIIDRFRNVEYSSFDSLIHKMSEEILNGDLSRLEKVNSKGYKLLNYADTLVNQTKQDGGKAIEFLDFFKKIGNIITGSLAYRYQGTVYRGVLDSLHDIDMIVPYEIHGVDISSTIIRTLLKDVNRSHIIEWLESQPYFAKVKAKYPKVRFGAAYSSGNFVTVNAVYSENEVLSDKFLKLSGSYASRLEHFTEEERKQIYLFDFFLNDKNVNTNYVYSPEGYKLAKWDIAFAQKQFAMGRAKDIFDYQMWQRFDEFKDTIDTDANNLMYQKPIESTPNSYEGMITPDANTIFVFGSNPEGRHGAGAAKTARLKFGAKYGQGEGLQGNAYALPTKDLRVKENNSMRSIPTEQITENIKKMYDVARQNPSKQFKVAYTHGLNETSLNGYTGAEMIKMFKDAGPIPSNVIFSKNWTDHWNEVASNISTQSAQSTPVTQENFKPEYQLDRSKLEADTRYDQLRKDMSSRTIELRAQHIAKEFANKVMPMLDEVIAAAEEEHTRLKEEGAYKNRKELLSLETKLYKLNLIKVSGDRIKAIQAVGPEAIFKAIKEELQEYADMSEEDFVNETDLDASKQAEYKKFVKNFDALQNYALYYINMREGVKIEEDETDSEEKRIAEGNTGWGFKVRLTDPYTTSSAITKHLLNSLSMLDKNGDVVFDDLGNVITLTGNYAHSALMHELSKIKEPSDFVEYDANGKPSFPALEDMVAKYPWVEQLIGELESNPEIISTVFNDFRQDFISYWVVVEDKKTKKLITKRVNHATAREAVVPLVEHNFEYGELQSEDSLFAVDRTINKGNISKALELHKEAKRTLQQSNQKGYDTLISNITELLKMTGFSIEEVDIEAVLNGKEGLEETSQILAYLSNYLTSLKSYEGTNLIEDYKSKFYNPVADIVSKVNSELTLDSFRDHGKSYYSYSAPNFLNTLIKHLKDMDGDKRRAYMDKHFKQYKWYYDEKTGWKSEWLRAFYEDDGITDRDALDVMNLLAIEGNEYRDWTMGNIMKGFITAYFGANSNDFAWYNTPIFADSPMANLIKMRKVKGKDNAEMKKTLLDRFETVVRQELWRMRLVEERKGKVTPIVNWDAVEKNGKRGKDGGNTFYFFPELNDYVTKEGDTFFEAYNKLAAAYAQNQNVTQFQRSLKSLIQTAVSDIMENNYKSFRADVTKEGVENALKESIVPESMKTQDAKNSYFENALEEYYWNNAYAQTQIIELTTVDPAFYKNDGGVDFQKRFKEIYAAGSRLNTALPYDEGGRKYERTIYIADDIRISPSYKDIEQGLRKAADEKKFGEDVKMGHAVVDDILFKFRDINSTDGQAYRSLKSFRSVVKMLGKWNDKMEEAYNRFRAGNWEMSDFYVVWNTIKPYVFTIDDVPTGVDEAKYGKTMPVPHQNKNSEFLLLAMYGLLAERAGLSPQMRGINRFMEDYDIDVVQFESAAKVGGQGIVNLNYSRTALAERGYDSYSKYQNDLYAKLKAGKITQEQFNQAMDDILPSEEEVIQILKDAALKARDDKFIVKDEKTGQTYNAEVVHSHSYDDYMIAQPTPEHLFDTETVFGTQINALITADLPADFSVTINGKTYDKNGIRKFYKSLKVENLLEDFQKIKDRFKSIEDFQKALEETIKDNPKYGREVLDAIQLVPDGHGGKMFNIPLNNPSTTIKLQEVITSMFKNNITKQKIKGGANILVSNFGYTNQLKLVYNKEGDVASGIKHAECYMPAWSKKYFREFMDENGNIDIDKIPDNLKEMVVYRIPTEHKYSMLPIKIVGFLPIQNGSCMMLPMETVAQAGEDFDVDKKFVFMPEFEPPTFKGKKKQQFIEDFIKYKEGQGVKVSKDAVRQAADMIEADIESDEGTLEAEASNFYWDNYKEYGLNQIRKIEYDHTKTPAQNTRAQRNNMLIDIIKGILTSPQVVEQVNHAGNYDHVKKASRLSRIVNDPVLVQAYMQEKKIANLDELAEHFLNVDLDTLDDFMKKHKKAFNWLDPRTFMYFHRQNMAGDALIGLYANNSVAHAKYQEFGIGIHGDFQFTINGVRMDSISKMRTADGTLISFNNAEFLAAAPDNAKDPVLADLMQNPNTANLTAAMLRMGMNIQDIGLLFNQPTIKELIERGTLNGLSDVLDGYIEYVQTFDGAYSVSKTPSVTSKELLMNILNADTLDKLKDSKKPEEMKQYAEALAKTLPALQVMVNIQRIANDLSTLTNMSRADSTNGAIATTVAQALNQKRKVEVFTKKAATGKTAITNVEGVIKNGKVTADMDIDEMRMHIDDGDVAMLQAYYSLGIEMALPLMARYFPQVSQAVEDIFNIISDNAPRQMIPQAKSKKTPYSVDQLLKDITTFALSGTKMFGDDGVNTYEQKRNYYIYEFPKKFVEILEQNPDLENIATLKKLVVKQGKIQFDNQGKMSTHTRNNLMSELDLLLTSENPVAQELLEDLIKYSYYTEQLNFGPKSFGTFISPKVLNAFPEFAQTLRDIPTIMSRPTAITRFIDQMYAQNVQGMLKTYKDFKKLKDGTIEQSFKGKYAEAPDYLAFLEDHPTLTTEITTIEDGKTVKKQVPVKVPVAYKLARSYREKSEDMTVGIYEKVGLFLNKDGIRYNMNMDASNMAKQPFDSKKWAALQSLYGRQQRESESMRRAEEERAKMWEMDGMDYMEDNDFDIDAQEAAQELGSEPNFDVDAAESMFEKLENMGDFDAFFAQEEGNNTYDANESIATLNRKMC